ncbi:hypothetical protein WQQ_20470 [Hydrocarboniphaga effusa AP103]|uniref:DUF2798 domain-containing protein n=1 Tax=Hydrocarboniphaga effusa AP103 TaxID=1172194 RepID=I8TD53_9GAMM|nr:hypothetical protein WQQ_20470 [Hydrocarboniphaga effusa AP103]
MLGFDASFASAWLPAWFMAWAVAFPTVLVIAPITRKIVDGMIVRAP